MSITINCKTGEDAIECLSNGFNCNLDEFHNFFAANDFELEYSKVWQSTPDPFEKYLYNKVIEKFGYHKELSCIHWFHTTRTIENNSFSRGILPLHMILHELWDMLIDIVEANDIRTNLRTLKKRKEINFHYDLKTSDSLHSGPYAIMVKDVAYHSSRLSQHDYLAMPEIIEDICNGYEELFNHSILKIIESKLIPTIVEFSSIKQLNIGHIETAICYVNSFIKIGQPCSNSIMCFDGEGDSILNENIIEIESKKL